MDYSVFLHWFFFSVALIEVLNLDKQFYTFFFRSSFLCNSTHFCCRAPTYSRSFPPHEITPCNPSLSRFSLHDKSFFACFFNRVHVQAQFLSEHCLAFRCSVASEVTQNRTYRFNDNSVDESLLLLSYLQTNCCFLFRLKGTFFHVQLEYLYKPEIVYIFLRYCRF